MTTATKTSDMLDIGPCRQFGYEIGEPHWQCAQCRGTGRKLVARPPQIACGDLPDPTGMLAWIIADPDEDTHRLVYADRLDELGEHQRAEFVRTQAALDSAGWCDFSTKGVNTCFHRRSGIKDVKDSGCPACKERVPLVAEMWSTERVWISKNQKEFRRNVGFDLMLDRQTSYMPHHLREFPTAVFRRGFIKHVHCRWDEWAEHGDLLRSREWVPSVTLVTRPVANEIGPVDSPNLRAVIAGRTIELEPSDDITESASQTWNKVFSVRWPGTSVTLSLP